MSYDAVIIRPAEKLDLKSIWHLLHANCKVWSDEMICNELPELFVLTYRERIISVFHGTIKSDRIEEFWIITHPFYEKYLIKLAIKNIMLSVLGYQLLNN
jgi:hypothetical protein